MRKDYSLPIVSAPSGGFRIKRKNPLTGETVYQVSSIADGGYACGFEKDKDGNIDMSKNGVTFHQTLKDSPKVAYMGKSGKPCITKQGSGFVELFGNTRKVDLPASYAGISKSNSYLTLAEAQRVDIKISIEKQLFKDLCQFSDIDADRPPSNISIAFNKNTDKETHDKFKKCCKNIPMPRDSGNTERWAYKFNVRILRNEVELSYRTALSSNMKEAYQNGTPAE